jgi:3-oxoacyl-(acyl-carrier-protein) synthase
VSARPQYRRVAITGMGAMTSLGGTIPSLWGAILAGRSGVSYIKQFDSGLFPVSIGGEIDLEAMRDPELDGQFPGCGRAAHFGSWAAGRAWQDAQFASGALDESRAGVCIGASTFPVIEDRLDRLGDLLDEQGWNRRKYLELAARGRTCWLKAMRLSYRLCCRNAFSSRGLRQRFRPRALPRHRPSDTHFT